MEHIVIMTSICYMFEESDEADRTGCHVLSSFLEMNPIITSE